MFDPAGVTEHELRQVVAVDTEAELVRLRRSSMGLRNVRRGGISAFLPSNTKNQYMMVGADMDEPGDPESKPEGENDGNDEQGVSSYTPGSSSSGFALFVLYAKGVLIWMFFLMWAVFRLLLECQFPLLFLLLYFVTDFLLKYHGDILVWIATIYSIFAEVLNFIIGYINAVWLVIRPFANVYNYGLWMMRTIFVAIFASLSITQVEAIIKLLIPIAQQLSEIIAILINALAPVLIQLIPAIITILQELIVKMIPTFILLVQLAAKLVIALVPVLVTLVPILVSFVQNVLTSFGGTLVLIIQMLVDMLVTSIPFITEVINNIVLIVIDIRSRVTPGMDAFSFFVIVITSSLKFIVNIVMVIVNMVVTLVQKNIRLIVNLVVDIINQLVLFIPPIIRVIIVVVIENIGVLIGFISVLISALISLLPAVVSIFNSLLSSGIISDLITALLSAFTAPSFTHLLAYHATSAAETTFHTLSGFAAASVIEKIATSLASFLASAIPMIVQAAISIVNSIITLIPTIITLIINLVSSPTFVQLIMTFVNLVITFIPILVNIIMSLIDTAATLIPTLLQILLNAVIDLLPVLISLVKNLPVGIVVNALKLLVISLTDMIPIILNIVLDLVASPSGLVAIKALFTSLVDMITELFKPGGILTTIIVSLITAIFGVFMSLFTGSASTGAIEPIVFAIKFVIDIVGGFFTMLIGAITGNVGIAFDQLLANAQPLFTFIDTLKSVVGAITGIFSRLKILELFAAALKGIVDLLQPVVDFIMQIYEAILKLF